MPQTEHDAVALARRRLEEQRALLGDRHPDYASALNQFALTAIMHGNPDEAEPLLLEALEIRKQTVGEAHPDYATNLSSLAGLLWARGDLAAAERLLRQAIDIRVHIFGPDHPKTVASLRSLDELVAQQASPGTAGVVPELEPADATMIGSVIDAAAPMPAVTGSAGSEPVEPVDDALDAISAENGSSFALPALEHPALEPGLAALRERSERLQRDWSRLADELSRAAEALRHPGVPASAELAEELRSSSARFDVLREDVARAAEGLGLDGSEVRSAADRAALDGCYPALERAERSAWERSETQREALEVLDRALALVHTGNRAFPPLDDCLSQVRRWREDLAASGPGALPDDAAALVAGTHPVAAVVALAGNDEQLSDERWTELMDAVRDAFGEPLAVALARGRIVIALDSARG
jgi:tetratricopeptide (TPR) repeat protein